MILLLFYFLTKSGSEITCNSSLPDFLTIAAVGDNLFAKEMLKPTGDYRPFYSEIKPFIEKADIAFVNQETVLISADKGYTGYPRFGTPQEVGHALIDTGFNVINQASNHVMDKGVDAVYDTLDFWDAYPNITCLGIQRSSKMRGRQSIIERNKIKVGFLSYTYGTNGIPVPKRHSYLVSRINKNVMAKEIDALRPNCDVLVVSMHWGHEFELKHNAKQEMLAHFLANHSVDIIIGHHPHVLGDASFINRRDGGRTFCAYSLGNFISAQWRGPPLTLLGGLLYVKVKKTRSTVSVEEAGILPIVTHFEQNFLNFTVKPLFSYSDVLVQSHHKRIEGRKFDMELFNNTSHAVLGTFFLEKNSHFIN